MKCPTEVTYKNQLNAKRDSIEKQCNELWKEIVEMRSIEPKFANLFYSHNTTLPTLYTLVKTHKVPPGVDISSKRLEELKVRPIVSCSGSPTERLATLVTRITTPLLNFIPCHLKSIHQHLELLKNIESSDLKDLKFYTVDVAALFTNVNIGRFIENVLELAEEHWGDIPTYGIKLVDLHKLLEVVLGNSYFTFNKRLYEQIYGAFIRCSVSPPCAISTVYKLGKESINNDINFLSSPIGLFYGRYVDDSGSLARSKEDAVEYCRRISERDDGRIRWEVDFPEDNNQYTPFLDTEIKINSDGILSSRYYREPQSKDITLNYHSHHQQTTKEAVAKNYYRTAIQASSGPVELQHSFNIVDSVLKQNGYPCPLSYATAAGVNTLKRQNNNKYVTLTLPYTTEKDANRNRNYIKANKMQVRPVFTPERTLKQTFSKSRPLDNNKCVLGNPERCTIFPIISNSTCSIRGAVYQILCGLCNSDIKYQGETDRLLHHRLKEHVRAAANPTAYPENALGQHYAELHKNCNVTLHVYILNIQQKTS